MINKSFEWDEIKNLKNIAKHGVSFFEAQEAFSDVNRIIDFNAGHSHLEERYYCIGKTERGIVTVRYTIRNGAIRIIGAGYWRKGKKAYERKNRIC